MDAGQSPQISSSSPRDLISPCKGTHTLTVREYEQTIDELKKENFNLKLKLYLCDETHKKTCRDKDSTIPNDEMVQVVVHLSSESESLRAELKEKENLLQDALERAEKLESEFKDLEKINAELQSELTSFSELPSKEEISLLLEEKKNFVNQIHSLESIVKEKEEEIDTLNQKIEILANENIRLEDKIKKRSLAIQGFVYKSYKEKEMLPDELKNIVISAIQAAKNKNKNELAVAVKTFNSSLNKIMSTSELSSSQSEENSKSMKAKCLKEVLEKPADSFLSSQTVSPSHIAHIEDLKEDFSERNTYETQQTKELDSFVHRSYIRGKMVHQNAVNILEKDVIDFCDISPSTEENLISFSEKPSQQTCSVIEHDLIDIKTGSLSPAFYKLTPEKDTSGSDQFVYILKENEQLKQDLEEKLLEIKDLREACDELKRVHLLETRSDAIKASEQCCVSTQTKLTGNKLYDEYEVMKIEKGTKLPDNVEELQKNVLLLLLTIEEKDKELSEIKQSLADIEEDMKKISSTTNTLDKEFYMMERNDLHERLAVSYSINEKLMKHLKSLEKFMEDLLQHKFDSSLESTADKSDFMSSVSKCLNESLNLSKILSDNLSICEGSKLFEECESFTLKNGSYSEDKVLPYLGLDRLSMPEQLSYSGSHTFKEYISHALKNNMRVGKESDSSQLCWRCWQQLIPPLNQSELSQLMKNNSLSKPTGYQSSDSDIWSEPDRNVSMQRIGISLQNSPVSSKSPRKLRQKDKRLSSRISSKEDTSSSEYQQAFKKRQGSASRRLFAKEESNIKNQDAALDKFYFLVAEKYSKLKSLLEDLESIKDGKLSNDGWIRLNMLLCAVGDTLQKLHFAKENAKASPACGKCIMLELFSNLKASYVDTDFDIGSNSYEQKILREFSRELCLLKEACKKPFSILHEIVSKKSVASQCEAVMENDQKELENIINNLTNKNRELNENLQKIKQIFSEEKKELVSVKAENTNLLNEIDNLKIDLVDAKWREKEFSLKNEKLEKELTHTNKSNSELNVTLKELEQKMKESNIELDKLTAELEKSRSDLIHMNEKCIEYEKQLNEQKYLRENSENKLKNLGSESLSEKKDYISKIDELNLEKDNYVQELKTVQEKSLVLEKENAVLCDRLESKNNELTSLKATIEKLQNIKETQDEIENESISKLKIIFESIKTENFRLLSEVSSLKEEVLDKKYKEKELSLENKKLVEKLDHATKNYSELNNTLENLNQKNKESNFMVDELRAELNKNKLDLACINKKCQEYEKQINKEIQMKEKIENQLKTLQHNSQSEKENYLLQLETLNTEKNHYEQELENMKIENLKLSNQIHRMEEELAKLKIKEKELSLKNEKFVEEWNEVNKNNSKLNYTLKILEEKEKDSDTRLDRLTAELQKNKLDLTQLSEKCLTYEKQLNEQIQLQEKYENLKLEESNLMNEKKHHLGQISELNKEKNHYLQKIEVIQEQKLVLEKDIAILNETLLSKNNEFSSLQKTIENLKLEESNLMNEKKHHLRQINELNKEKNHYLQKIEVIQEQKLVLEKDIAILNERLLSKNNEFSSLQKTIEELQKTKETLDSNYKELQLEFVKNQECVTNLQEKCKNYEEIIEKFKKTELEYCQQLKQLDAESASEKEKLSNKISELTKDRAEILQQLKEERESYEKLKVRNIELNENYNKTSQQVSALKQKNEALLNALDSSNNECDNLNKDLKSLRNTLQHLESKCLMYEKQLVASADIKDNLTECLLNINNDLSVQRQKINEMCKIYGNDNSAVWGETSFTKFIPVIDEDNLSKLSESVVSETKKLSQCIDMLLSTLKSYHSKSIETETQEEKNRITTQSLKKQMEFHKTEAENLHSQNDNLHHIIDDLQKSISEKEKLIECSTYKMKTLKEKLQNSQREIDRENQLIQRKDDEITMLQERIFNLQTYVNNIMTDKKNTLEKTTSMHGNHEDSVRSSNLLSSKIVSMDNKMCQTDECEVIPQDLDESFTSVSSLESGKNRCCEKYWKKCYSLQSKLVLCRKRIEILEKNKADIKESLIKQLQNKKDSDDKSDSAVSKLAELESKLEKKKLFICELKSELLDTCNSLIDKEKEIDDLKQKLAECEVVFKQETFDASKLHPTAILSCVDANVKTLKNHKWKLIQTIFDIQRKFYEKKGIHLNYFDRFKEHVNNLYSLQLIPSMSKSESMPLLKSHVSKEKYEQGNAKVKKLADLELDIECLENLKIFLNRFLVPCVFQTPESSDKEAENKRKAVSSNRLSLPVKCESEKKSQHEVTDILNLSFPETHIMSEEVKNQSIDFIASSISQHLDYIKAFLNIVMKRNWQEILDLSDEGSVDKAELKSLLLNIFKEIGNLNEGTETLFDLNAHLKSFNLVALLQAPLSTTKLDASDRESVMSEETIAVSRTESPLSFEDSCPIKLPHPETLQLEENSIKARSVGQRVTVIEPYSTKMTMVEGSCDSVCQRSHYSSPDLGIESDPNHDSSAPEHKEDGANKYQIFPFKLQKSKTAFTSAESAGRWPGPKFGETFYAISTLQHFELLKQEIKESLVAIKSVLSRTGDGLHHIAKYTSPRKTLEYNTLKSIKDTCVHMEVCLKEANNLVGKFWTAPCPTEKEWKMLNEENQKLSEDLLCLRNLVEKQENEFKAAMGKLEHAQAVKDNIEKKISKKLVKTKKLIRQAELRLLETRCQNIPPVPKYPSEQTAQADAH